MKFAIFFLLIFASTVSGQNFRVVHNGDNERSELIRQRAESLRKDIALAWFRRELPPAPEPCILQWGIDDTTGHGATSYVEGFRRPRNVDMRVFGRFQNIMDDVLPHEVFHWVMRDYLGFRVERWMDEGGASTTETDRSMRRSQDILYSTLQQQRGIPINELMLAQDYPRDVTTFYAQSVSLSRFLLGKGGPFRFSQLALGARQTGSWTIAVNRLYQYESLKALQDDWLKWVKDGSPDVITSLQPIPTDQAPFRPQPFGSADENPYVEEDAQALVNACPPTIQPPAVSPPSIQPPTTINPPSNPITPKPTNEPTKIVVPVDQVVDKLSGNQQLIQQLVIQLQANSQLAGKEGTISQSQMAAIVSAVISQIPPTQIDYDQIAAAVIARLPPIEVETYNLKEQLIDKESYPYPGPIKIKKLGQQ